MRMKEKKIKTKKVTLICTIGIANKEDFSKGLTHCSPSKTECLTRFYSPAHLLSF